MFAIDCHVHGTRVLIDWSRIEGAHDSPEGPVLETAKLPDVAAEPNCMRPCGPSRARSN